MKTYSVKYSLSVFPRQNSCVTHLFRNSVTVGLFTLQLWGKTSNNTSVRVVSRPLLVRNQHIHTYTLEENATAS